MNGILDRFKGNISPIALLATSFFWSWFDIVPFSPAFFSVADKPADSLPLLISLLSSVFVLLLFAFGRRLRSLAIGSGAFAVFSFVFGCLGSFVLYSGIEASSMRLIAVGAVFTGCYQGIGAVVVGGVAVCQGRTNALIHMAAALPFNMVAILLAAFLRPLPSVAFSVTLPALAALCYAVFVIRGENGEVLRSIERTRSFAGTSGFRRLFCGCDIVFFVLLSAVCASFGFVNHRVLFFETSAPIGFGYLSLAVRAVMSLAVLAGYLRLSWRPYSILRASLLIMAFGLAANAIMQVEGLSGSVLSSSLFLAGYACFDLIIWAVIIALNYKSGASLQRSICAVYAVDQLGIFAGTALGAAVSAPSHSAIVYICLGVLLTAATVAFVGKGNAVSDGLGEFEIDFSVEDVAVAASSSKADAGQVVEETVRSLDAEMLRKIAARYFLTSREQDILALLVEGRSGPYISKCLYVSDNTVKTHIRHIYTKLDVHNRQELLDLVRSPIV